MRPIDRRIGHHVGVGDDDRRLVERLGIIGSPNFDNRSFELNDEIVLICDSMALNAALRDTFEADLARANRLDEYERGVVDRLRGGLYHVLLALREQL